MPIYVPPQIGLGGGPTALGVAQDWLSNWIPKDRKITLYRWDDRSAPSHSDGWLTESTMWFVSQ